MRLVWLIFTLWAFTSHADIAEKPSFFSVSENKIKAIYIQDPVALQLFDKAAEHWALYKPSMLTKLGSPAIPKIIHQIWLGPAKLPSNYAAYMKECRDLHPDWEYKLWTNKEAADFDFPTKDLYLSARSYAEKADILRMEILYKYGGLYLDTDILCLKPFDELLDYYEFFAGVQSNLRYVNKFVVQNALVASVPNNILLRNTADSARKQRDKRTASYENAHFIDIKESLANWHRVSSEEWLKLPPPEITMSRTFPNFTENVVNMMNSPEWTSRMMIFPLDYFFPVYNQFERGSSELWMDVNEYSFSVHDYLKNTRFIKFLPLNFNMLEENFSAQDKMAGKKYKQFTKYIYRPNTISKTLHFIDLGDTELDAAWREGPYLSWQTELWTKERINAELEGRYLDLLKRAEDDKAFALLAGMIIVKKYGGVYVNKQMHPGNENLFDLIYTVDFFAGLSAKETDGITVSDKILGAKASHKIIEYIIDELENTSGVISLHDIQDAIWNKGYEYIHLDGRNVFLPQEYFEPKSYQTYSILR